jgi:hypothetical protein
VFPGADLFAAAVSWPRGQPGGAGSQNHEHGACRRKGALREDVLLYVLHGTGERRVPLCFGGLARAERIGVPTWKGRLRFEMRDEELL